jgi:hypothetical protein
MLDQGITTALWGARHPDQLRPVDEVTGWCGLANDQPVQSRLQG